MDITQRDWLRNSGWDRDKENMILIHGYGGSVDALPMVVLRDGKLETVTNKKKTVRTRKREEKNIDRWYSRQPEIVEISLCFFLSFFLLHFHSKMIFNFFFILLIFLFLFSSIVLWCVCRFILFFLPQSLRKSW